jgi:hypothetical protein
VATDRRSERLRRCELYPEADSVVEKERDFVLLINKTMNMHLVKRMLPVNQEQLMMMWCNMFDWSAHARRVNVHQYT